MTALRKCANNKSHVEIETVDTSSRVIKPATPTANGMAEYTATFENPAFETQIKVEIIPAEGYGPGEDPNQKGTDGTDVGPGASAASAHNAITTLKSDTDPEVAGNAVEKGTYYKFIIVALNDDNNVVSTSKLIHVASKGGKVGNHKSVTVRKSIRNKAQKLKKGRTLKLKAKAVRQSKKLAVKKHVAIRYESTDNTIATVSKKGKIRAKSKGTCYVYAFAQNGVSKQIKVVVK